MPEEATLEQPLVATSEPKPFEKEQKTVAEDPLAKVGKRIKEQQAKVEQPPAPENKEAVPATEATPTVTAAETKEGKPAEKKKYQRFTKDGAAKEPKAEGTQEAVSRETEVNNKNILPKEIEDELNSLRAIANRVSVKMVLKAEESGKPFTDFYGELQSKDPSKLPYKDLYKMFLTEQGATQAEIDRKMEKFAEKDEDDQFDAIALFRKGKKEAFDKELNEYTPKPQEVQVDPNVAMWQEFEPKYQDTAKQYEGKELYGIVVTPEMRQGTADFYKNNSLINLVDGKLDPQDAFRKTFLIQNFDLIMDNFEEKVKQATVDELEEKYNVGKPLSSQNGSSAPQSRQVMTDEEKRIQNLKASLPK